MASIGRISSPTNIEINEKYFGENQASSDLLMTSHLYTFKLNSRTKLYMYYMRMCL